MEPPVRWTEIVSDLDQEQRELLFGTSLSRRFSRLPLWISHPANIGMFYGFLISLALIFPYTLRYDNLNESFSNWLLFSALFMAACLVLGFSSLILVALTKRMPMTPPRIILYPMPFLGIGFLGRVIAAIFVRTPACGLLPIGVDPETVYFSTMTLGGLYGIVAWRSERWI